MRQLLVQVPPGHGEGVAETASRCGGSILSRWRACDQWGDPIDLVIVHLPNAQVGPFVDALDPVPEPRLALAPRGVLTLEPPTGMVAEHVKDVSQRSPIEIFLSGLQSVGS